MIPKFNQPVVICKGERGELGKCREKLHELQDAHDRGLLARHR